MAELTIQVPDRAAEQLSQLKPPILADSIALDTVIRCELLDIKDRLHEIAESAAELPVPEMLRLTTRISVLADACKALNVPEEAKLRAAAKLLRELPGKGAS